MSRRRTSWSNSDSEEEGSYPQPKSHCSVESDSSSKVSNKGDENTSGPPFLSKDGETFYKGKKTTKKIADFSLKLIGEVHQNGHARKDASREGRWLVSMTCSVFSSKETRTITLTASDFDTSKKLLKRVRSSFPDNTIQLAPPDNLMQAYWQWLQSSYDPKRARKVYQTDHLGLQEDNYWLLDEEIHLWKNSSVPEDERLYFLATDAKMRATEFNKNLLNEDNLLPVLKRVMDKSSYFTVNQNSFKMAFSFCLTRLIRLKDTEDTWGESNIGLLFSKEKNCGKSLTLRILAKLQGMRSQHDGLLFSGGNQNTSGTSNQVLLDILSRTTLVVMIDDPLFSKPLAELLQQVQGGLSQGSAKSGICTPKGSILISSNSDAVERNEGRVQRIDYKKDESFQLDDQEEKELNDLAEGNKGFLVALTMRYVELWDKLKKEAIPVLQEAIEAAFPNQQLRWVKGQAYTLLTFAMLHALVQQPFNLLEVISGLHADKPQLTPLQQLQVAAFERMKCDPSQIITWISPFCNPTDKDGKKLPALAFSQEGIRNLGKDVSEKGIQEVLPGPKYIKQPHTFAKSRDTPLNELRRKKGGEATTSKRAHKIPLALLSELFVEWVKYFIGKTKQEPDKPFSQEEFSSQENPLATLNDKMASLERTIISKIKEFRTKQAKDQAATGSSTESLEHSVVQALSPNTETKFFSYTQEKQQGFIEGFMYTSRRPVEGKSSATSVHKETTPFLRAESSLEKEANEKKMINATGSLSTVIPRSHHNEVGALVTSSKTITEQRNMPSITSNQMNPIQNQAILQATLNVQPQPNLVPFLERTLPQLQAQLRKEASEKDVSAAGSLNNPMASTAISGSHHNEVRASVAASKTSAMAVKELQQSAVDKRSTSGKQKRKEASGHKIVDQCSPSPSKVSRTGEKSDFDVDIQEPGASRTSSSDHSFAALHSIPEPIAFYPLNSKYGTREIDNRQPQGTSIGVSLAPGSDRMAVGSYQFAGKVSSYIKLPNNRVLDTQRSITVLCWVNPQDANGLIFDVYNTIGIDGIYLCMESGKLKFFPFRILCRDAQSTPKLITDKSLELNQWHYVGVSYDHSSGIASLWLNGQKVVQQDIGAGMTLATHHNVKLGVSRPVFPHPFMGQITAVQIFDAALTMEQMNAVRNAGQAMSTDMTEGLFDFPQSDSSNDATRTDMTESKWCDSPESDSSNDDESRNRRSWQDERRPREKTPAGQERAMRTDMTEGLFDFSDSDSIF